MEFYLWQKEMRERDHTEKLEKVISIYLCMYVCMLSLCMVMYVCMYTRKNFGFCLHGYTESVLNCSCQYICTVCTVYTRPNYMYIMSMGGYVCMYVCMQVVFRREQAKSSAIEAKEAMLKQKEDNFTVAVQT